jgi:hypothetical protein
MCMRICTKVGSGSAYGEDGGEVCGMGWNGMNVQQQANAMFEPVKEEGGEGGKKVW